MGRSHGRHTDGRLSPWLPRRKWSVSNPSRTVSAASRSSSRRTSPSQSFAATSTGATSNEIVSDEGPIGAILLIPEGDGVEVKNIALLEAYRGRGLGRATIEAAARVARRSGARRLRVGTADTSSGTLSFYRRVGFRDAGRIAGFFDSYPEPVIEDGRVAHDMIRFEMEI